MPTAAPLPLAARGPADDRQAGDLDVHEASTLILDEDRQARRIADPMRRAATHAPDPDDALHSAPTLILDHRAHRRRRPSGG